MKNIYLATILSTGLLLAGCASIVGSSVEKVSLSSNVEGVSLVVKNRAGYPVYRGSAFTTLKLSKKAGYFSGETYSCMATKKGYKDQTIQLDTGLSGWYWGNILIGGLIGMLIVDPATGAMWTFDENTLFFDMEKE